jgi:hypothetical protein
MNDGGGPGLNRWEDWGEKAFSRRMIKYQDRRRGDRLIPHFPWPGGGMFKQEPAGSAVRIEGGDIDALVDQLSRRVGAMPDFFASVWSLFDDLFLLSKGVYSVGRLIPQIWGHSIRTAYLAALIAEVQMGSPRMVWQAFAGGLLHDVGLLVLLTQKSQFYSNVLERARICGVDLHTIERGMSGTTHAQVGADFLTRWGIEGSLIATVAFHDEPYRLSGCEFCPATAVYLANLLDGGGIAQDSDGIPGAEGEAYLLHLGLYDRLPYWQACMRDIQELC